MKPQQFNLRNDILTLLQTLRILVKQKTTNQLQRKTLLHY